MDPEITPSEDAPEGGTVIKPIAFAWIWSSVPWLAVMSMLYAVGFIPEEITLVVLAVVIMVPRYVGHRRTLYVLARDELIYQRGGIFATKRVPIPISSIKDVRVRHGFLGRTLGYQTVDVLLENGAIANMAYISALTDVAAQLREMMVASGWSPQDDQESDGAPEGDGVGEVVEVAEGDGAGDVGDVGDVWDVEDSMPIDLDLVPELPRSGGPEPRGVFPTQIMGNPRGELTDGSESGDVEFEASYGDVVIVIGRGDTNLVAARNVDDSYAEFEDKPGSSKRTGDWFTFSGDEESVVGWRKDVWYYLVMADDMDTRDHAARELVSHLIVLSSDL